MKYYDSINTLPFNLYKRLTLDNDLTALVIEGEPEKEALQAAKEKISEEFAEAIGGAMLEDYVSQVGDLEGLNMKKQRIENLLLAFIKAPTRQLLDLLINEGFNYPTDDLYNFGKCVYNELCSWEQMIELNKVRLEKRFDEKVQPSYEYYADIMISIRANIDGNVNDKITTLEFCRYYHMLIKYLERQRNANGTR